MARTKKTEKKKVEKIEEPVAEELTEEVTEVLRVEEDVIKSTEDIYSTVFLPSVPLTDERAAMAKAITTVRTLDMKGDMGTESMLLRAFYESREIVLKTVIARCLRNDLTLIDVPIILEMLAKDAGLLALWEYKNPEVCDLLTRRQEPVSPESIQNMVNIFENLGNKKNCEDCDDCDE